MDLFDLSAKITLDTSEYEKGVKSASKSFSGLGSKLKAGAGFAAKATIAAVGAATTAVGAIVKSAVESYADYEQLVGGVETLFKDSAGAVQEYAQNAYKTAGLSANEYMETVTSFSASLLQSLGGDTQAAASYADMAVTDMADNANKMGTSMESIQSAYQGFAKQNYTMLDNLKLGYGGTKTEMERLIQDAENLDSSFKATRDTNGDLAMSYADIVDAIHIVQTEMGITGTTAAEASSTISGSFSQLKGAWQNFLTGLGNADADLSGLIDNLVSSAGTLLENLKPVVLQSVQGIAAAIQEAAPIIAEVLPQIAVELIPPLLSAAAQLVGALVSALPGILSAIWAGIKEVGKQLWPVLESVFSGVAGWFSEKFQAAKEAVQGAFEGIGEFFASVWADIVGVFEDAKNVGVNVVNDILDGISSVWDSIVSWVSGAWEKVKGLFTIDVSFIGGGKGHAIGLDYVPSNNYPALLHRGEAVLTAREADEWRRGGSGSGKIVNLNIYAQQLSQADMDYIVATVNRELA